MKKENNIRYLTAEKPPTDDNSEKVPTTAWVRDVVEAASAGAYPVVQATTKNGITVYAPSGGGTWYCFGTCGYKYKISGEINYQYGAGTFCITAASGASLYTPDPHNGYNIETYAVYSICIKIA